MSTSSKEPLKVGVIDFINSYPLFYALRHGQISTDVEFKVGLPQEVNQMLEQGEVDIALISSSSYVDNRSNYILLSDYGIGATDKVLSICLFCRKPIFDFRSAQSFLIPSHSMTSTRLLKILSEHYWKSNACFHMSSLSEDELFEQDLPFLLIGDACLKKRHLPASVADLAHEWHEATGYGFAIALVATRNDAFIKKQDQVLRFHKSLVESYAWSRAHETTLINICSKKLSISPQLTREYFKTLDYELIQDHLNGLDHFSTFRA